MPLQISTESEEFIVEQYKRLRQRDGSGSVSKSAWRITVRQLESMIRLSEAMARMHCCDEVAATAASVNNCPKRCLLVENPKLTRSRDVTRCSPNM